MKFHVQHGQSLPNSNIINVPVNILDAELRKEILTHNAHAEIVYMIEGYYGFIYVYIATSNPHNPYTIIIITH